MDDAYAYYTHRQNVYQQAMMRYYDQEYKQWLLEKEQAAQLDRHSSTLEKKIEASDAK